MTAPNSPLVAYSNFTLRHEVENKTVETHFKKGEAVPEEHANHWFVKGNTYRFGQQPPGVNIIATSDNNPQPPNPSFAPAPQNLLDASASTGSVDFHEQEVERAELALKEAKERREAALENQKRQESEEKQEKEASAANADPKGSDGSSQQSPPDKTGKTVVRNTSSSGT